MAFQTLLVLVSPPPSLFLSAVKVPALFFPLPFKYLCFSTPHLPLAPPPGSFFSAFKVTFLVSAVPQYTLIYTDIFSDLRLFPKIY